VCQWCGKTAICQTNRAQALRTIKSRSNGRKRQAQANGNGYDQLHGDWLTYYQVASRFSHKAQAQDREDLLHAIVVNLADMGKSDAHKPDNLSWMYRIASFTIAQYWRDYYYQTNGVDCGHCSNPQRKKCKEQDLYSECPKAIAIERLNKHIIDGNGNPTELGSLIADDNAIDLDAWLDAKTWLLACPKRLIDIADKLNNGVALTDKDRQYLSRYRQQTQKTLF
jgi:hypothetical protein